MEKLFFFLIEKLPHVNEQQGKLHYLNRLCFNVWVCLVFFASTNLQWKETAARYQISCAAKVPRWKGTH